MIRFNLFGIPVSIEPWFWITMIFLGGGTQVNDRIGIITVALFVFAGFISILIHELGHAVTVKKYGLPTAISLVAFGGFASYPAGVLDRRQSFLVTAAGPGIQIILGILALLILWYLPMPENSLLIIFLQNLVWISIVWAIFNCLPIYPLDGGQMLAAILGAQRRNIVFMTGIVVATIMAVLSFIYLRLWFFPAFMAYFVWINWQTMKAQA